MKRKSRKRRKWDQRKKPHDIVEKRSNKRFRYEKGRLSNDIDFEEEEAKKN